MSLPEHNLNVALYVDDFLPYTHGWIYRQVSDPVTHVRTVLCNVRSEEKTFPFIRCVESSSSERWKEYIRGRFWFAFKYMDSRLSAVNKNKFKEELVAQNINLVHAHFGTNGVLIAPLCIELEIPLVVTFHGFDISSAPLRWPAYRKKLSLLFHQLTYAIAISEEMAERLADLGCPREKIKVSYLGVPVEEFPVVDRSARQTPLVFLHAGRLTAKKGVPDLVKAFAEAFVHPGEAELWIAGDGEEKSQVENTIERCNPSCVVKLLGRLSEEELQKARSEADVFVINCRTDEAGTKEGLPISILEASSTGMPVISTWHAGIPEAVQHTVSGLLVAEYDHLSLVQAMRKMLDAEYRLQMGKQASEYMKIKFALQECNKKLKSLYHSALLNH
ncbi:MAG: colanic acid biosynthesis glycosyltransferase WcaL [Chitinophagaceae bacterium]|nr:colanic acid biosynthesis glycosyltransferase WcaL [Chitinophagaceae bacterium]